MGSVCSEYLWRVWRSAVWGCAVVGVLTGQALSASVVISEIMTSRGSPVVDVDRDRSDWIELFNTGEETVDLSGWRLSDQVDSEAGWTIPSGEIGPGGFLVVFASGKDYRAPSGELHADFKLRQSGEILRLWDPQGRLRSGFTPQYPAQFDGFSYGLSMDSNRVPVIQSETEVRYHVPTVEDDAAAWRALEFDDSGWERGLGAIGYDRANPPLLNGVIDTDVVETVSGRNASLYARYEFADVAADSVVRLEFRYDDGCLLYLNGEEVLRRNAPSRPNYRSRSPSARQPTDVTVVETVVLGAEQGLRPGRNVLAVHLLNARPTDRDLLFWARADRVDAGDRSVGAPGYFSRPSPGLPNETAVAGLPSQPTASARSGFHPLPVEVRLAGAEAGAVIRYTIDGTIPDGESPTYQEPLIVEQTTVLRARIDSPRVGLGRLAEWHYMIGNADLADFSSNLPIVVVDTQGPRVSATTPTRTVLHLYDRGENGRARLDREPDLTGLATLKVRGSSTEGRPKKAFNVEFQDAYGEDQDRAVLGMPEDSDWILYAPYNFDRALIRNAFVYAVSNQLGMYATRTRFCEVYVNDRPGRPLDSRSYVGVYVLMEKIKRGANRVPVERLLAKHTQRPDVTGGYILKIDRLDPGDSGFSAGGQGLAHVYPKEDDRTSAQLAFLRSHLNAFDRAVRGSDPTDPIRGYPRYIDVESFVDFHMLNEFTKNPDGLRLSTYMHIPREGRLTMGPVWDFDRTLGPDDDGRAANPIGRSSVYNFGWWGRLFQVPDFKQTYADRWQAWRETVMTRENLLGIIDEMSAELEEAQERNFERWRLVTGTPGWRREIQQLKTWVGRRLEWFDTEFVAQPIPNVAPGVVQRGTTLRFVGGEGEVWVTTDGSDPRASGGFVSPSAVQLDAEEGLSLEANRVVTARVRLEARRGFEWSGPVVGTYLVDDVPRIVFSEIMYHPAPEEAGSLWEESDREFLELRSLDVQPVSLLGARLRDGVRFDFPDRVLEPGESILVVRNRDAFLDRYPDHADAVVGEFAGGLSNGGETLVLEDAHGRTIAAITYEDDGDWDARADGDGFSLELHGVDGDVTSPEAWRASTVTGGTPGQGAVVPVRILSWQALDGNWVLRFQGAPGTRYELQVSGGEMPIQWETLRLLEPTSAEGLGAYSETLGDEETRLFRILPRQP